MEKKEGFTLIIGGETLSLDALDPLRQRDKKALQNGEDYKLEFSKMRELGVDGESKFVLFIIRKFRPQTTLDEVDDLPIKVVQDVMVFALKRSHDIDVPFSMPSISLGQNMDGGAGK